MESNSCWLWFGWFDGIGCWLAAGIAELVGNWWGGIVPVRSGDIILALWGLLLWEEVDYLAGRMKVKGCLFGKWGHFEVGIVEGCLERVLDWWTWAVDCYIWVSFVLELWVYLVVLLLWIKLARWCFLHIYWAITRVLELRFFAIDLPGRVL